MRSGVGMIMVVLALFGARGAGSASTDFNPNGIAIFPVEGVEFNGTVAKFTDPTAPANAKYEARIEWGDGDFSDATFVSTGTKAWDVNGRHTYLEEGRYELHFTIYGGSGSGKASPIAQVADAPLTLKLAVPAVNEGSGPSGPIATFTDLDPNDTADEYIATIDWGDGVTSGGAVARTAPGAFTISGTHVYGEESQRTVKVTVRDRGGSSATQSQTITIADAPLTPGIVVLRGTEGVPLAKKAVATFHDDFAAAPASDYTVSTIDWGDGSKSRGTLTSVKGGNWQVVATHTYREEGRYTTTVAIRDRGGATATAHGAAIIADAPLHPYGRRLVAHARTRFSDVVATFTDAKFGKVGTTAHPDDYTVRIGWGDGRASVGTVSTVKITVAGRRVSRFAVTGIHTYSTPGPYEVTVTIRDRGGAAATATSRMTVSA
jgi:large repetitive protein